MVETALLVSVLGVVFAVSIPTFLRALRSSKIAEAPRELQRLHLSVQSYYGTTHRPTEDGPMSLMCLPPGAGPTPAQASMDPVEVRFAEAPDPEGATWRALAFEPDEAIRFRYSFLPSTSGCSLGGKAGDEPVNVELRAEGDLDGDGNHSRFSRHVEIHDGNLEPSPLLSVDQRVE